MAFVLLAIGALMSGAGLYAVVSGYPIIQVEEGWASVISGATLIAGGVVTIALALVLRALNEVKAAFEPVAARETPDMPDPAAVPPPPVDVPVTMAGAPAPALGEAVPDGRHDYGNPAGAPYDVAERLEAEPVQLLQSKAPQAEPAHAVANAELALAAARPADDYKLETPSTPEHDLPPVGHPDLRQPETNPPGVHAPDVHSLDHYASEAPAPERRASEAVASPPMDDWLDRAFAELDRDTPPVSPKPGTVPRQPVLERVSAVPPPRVAATHEDPAPAPPESALPEPASPEAAPASAVIGRYESDGTLYVMYADGSIEAQSAAGVYRFASMAELKAFIET